MREECTVAQTAHSALVCVSTVESLCVIKELIMWKECSMAVRDSAVPGSFKISLSVSLSPFVFFSCVFSFSESLFLRGSGFS